jgi:pantoate--beta-alanine ligase
VAREIAWGFRQLEDADFRKIDYIEVCDEATLQPARRVIAPSRVFAAAWLGRTRLIDNWVI